MNQTELFQQLADQLEAVQPTPAFEARLLRAVTDRAAPGPVFVLRRGPVITGAVAAMVVGVAATASAAAVGQTTQPINRVPGGSPLPSPTAVQPGHAYVSSGAPPVEHEELTTLAAAERLVNFAPLLAPNTSDRLTQVEVITYSVPAAQPPWQLQLAPQLQLTYATAQGTLTVTEVYYPPHPNGDLNIPGESGGVLEKHAGSEYLVSQSQGQVGQVTFASDSVLVTVVMSEPVPQASLWKVVAGVS